MSLTLPSLRPPSNASTDVVAFGENSLDFVAEVAPGPSAVGSKRSLTAFDIHVGGQMATAAVGVARLGFRAAYVGAFGDDVWGARVRDQLAAEGVDVRAVTRRNTPSRIAIVLVDALGERQVYEHRPAALVIAPLEASAADCAAGRLLMVDATTPDAALEVARHAQRQGVRTIVDADRVEARTDALLEAIDVIVVPEPFVIEWAGVYDLASGLSKLAERYPAAAAVVATRGPQGSLALAAGTFIETPGFEVAVADTTGAGDAFRAGLAAGWLRAGDHAELGGVLRFANATAALNCRAIGAQTALPTEAEVLGLLNGARG
jgi:sugar/nucleoside kinase (ribokinase family)